MAARSLQVIECGGTARSGKGTMVADYAEYRSGTATEETGADYRAVTRYLLAEGMVDSDMPPTVIGQKAASLGFAALTDIVAARNELVAAHGIDSLYTPDVSGTVAAVSPVPDVRKAVKAGFVQRVEAIRDNDAFQALIVDGRNLGPVVSKVAGAQLILRVFVSCLPVEAAWRDCARQGVQFGTTEGRSIFEKTLRTIEQRNQADATRDIDPVIPEPNAIDYWYDQSCLDYTVRCLAAEQGEIDSHMLFPTFFSPHRELTDITRRGVGYLGCETDWQVHFDTTPFRNYDNPKGAMLQASRCLFDEAFERDADFLA